MNLDTSSSKKRSRLRPLIMGWFFFSGIAALVYQVLWARQLELAFGSTLPAVSIILSVFMAGLALGSLLFGKLVDRWRNPLRLYAFLETGIGIYALLTPWIFQGLFSMQLYWGRFSATGVSGFSPMNLFFSSLVLLFPTILMGGTLPVMTKFIVSREDELGRQVGLLYFINTLGAATGSILAGFIMIAVFGLFTTTYVAAGINLLIGLLAFVFQRSLGLLLPVRVEAQPVKTEASEPIGIREPQYRWLSLLILPAYGLAGFAALALEVLLTRALVLVMGSSAYAFSLMLTAFLIGIAVGSSIISRYIDNNRNLWLWFGFVEVGIGISVVALTVFLGQAPFIMLPVFLAYSRTFWLLQLVQFLILFSAMLVPTLLMGAAFPLVSKLHAREMQRLGHAVGQVYAVNTVGAIVGPLVAGFIFIPFIGIQTSLQIIAFIYLIIGFLFLVLRPRAKSASRSLALSSLAVIMILVLIFNPRWDKSLMTSGVYYHPRYFSGASPTEALKNFSQGVQLLYYREGQLGTVSVVEAGGGSRVLSINGKPEASTHSDLSTQLLMGHIPVLLHEKPRTALMVGMGSGITLGAILQHSELEKIDTVEIEATVAEAAGFFSEANNNALQDPRLRLIFGDARNRVLTSPEKYDVIVAEPSNPWVSGATALFSREMLELYRNRLNEGGIVSQWIHLYSINTEDLKSMVNTFTSVFPYVTVWQDYTYPDIQFVGSLSPIRIDFKRFQEKLKEETVNNDLARISSNDPYKLLSYFLMDEKQARAYSSGARINSDNHPRLEFTTPKYLYIFTFGSNMESLVPFLTSPLTIINNSISPEETSRIETYASFRKHIMQGEAFQERSYWQGAVTEFEAALQLFPDNDTTKQLLVEAYEYLGTEYAAGGKMQESVDMYKKAMDLYPDRASAYKAMAVIAQSAGMLDKAQEHLLRAIQLAPNDPEAYLNLGNLYLQKKEFDNAITLFSHSLKISPTWSSAFAGRGAAYSINGEYDKAISDLSEAIRINPKSAAYFVERAKVYIKKGDYNRAITDTTLAIRMDSTLPNAYENRGIAYLNLGNYVKAKKDFSDAIALKPSAQLLDNRGLTHINLKQYSDALKDLEESIKLDASYDLPYYRLGYVYQETGKKPEAIASYEKFLTLSENDKLSATAKAALERLKTTVK